MTISFSLSLKDKPLIKSGQEIDFTTPLVKKGAQEEKIIPLSAALKINPSKIFLYLKKFVGDEIKQGELIAEKKSFLDKKQYLSEYDGTIKEIDHENGSLVITTNKETSQIVYSYFKGKISEFKKGEVALDVKDSKKFPVKEITADFGGPVLFIKEEELVTISPEEVKGKVIFSEGLKSYNQSKLEVMGVVGFVSNHSLNDSTPPPFAKVKEGSDWEQISKSKLPYCLIDKKTSTIYFYQSV